MPIRLNRPPLTTVLPFAAPWPGRYRYPEDEPFVLEDAPDDLPLAVLLARAAEREREPVPMPVPPDDLRCPAVCRERTEDGVHQPKHRCLRTVAPGKCYCTVHDKMLEPTPAAPDRKGG